MARAETATLRSKHLCQHKCCFCASKISPDPPRRQETSPLQSLCRLCPHSVARTADRELGVRSVNPRKQPEMRCPTTMSPRDFGEAHFARDHFTRWNRKSVIASNGFTTTYACFPSLFFMKNIIWPLTIANFILVSENSASKIQMCSRKPLSGGLHDLFILSFTRSCSAVFGSG